MKCLVDFCEKNNYRLGYCGTHYRRFKKYGDPLKYKREKVRRDLTCIYENCTNKRSKRQYCWNHYDVIRGYRPLKNKKMVEYAHRRKKTVFDHYGNKCACCGETNLKFLTMDHINNDGGEYRKKYSPATNSLYYWIIKNNYPTDLQILCWNCNCGRAYNGGICPHKSI